MARLSDIARSYIRDQIVSSTFEARKIVLDTARLALAEHALVLRLGHNWRNRVAQVPTGWLPTANRIWVKLLNDPRNRVMVLPLEGPYPLPADLVHGDPIGLDSRGSQDLIAIEREQERISESRRELVGEINRALRGFTTEAQLRDGWPEAYKYISQSKSAPAVNLPVVQIDQLKQKIAHLATLEA